MTVEAIRSLQSYSHAGQDQFAWLMSGKKANGCFLDLGSAHDDIGSNTYGLELIGWKGLRVDQNPAYVTTKRHSPWLCVDARHVDWTAALRTFNLPAYFDYLSVDVDAHSLAAIKTLLDGSISADIITIEHDAYAHGNTYREPQRHLLTSNGYTLVAGDVIEAGLQFEDWYLRTVAFSKLPGPFTKRHWKDILTAIEICSYPQK